MRRALLVGINTYQNASNLRGCVADAEAMANTLERHKDGSLNFECTLLADGLEDGQPIGRGGLRQACEDLLKDFKGEAVLYFSGHGILTPYGGYLCTTDAAQDDWGLPMQDVMQLAYNSPAHNILLILDCCHSGDIANPAILNTQRQSNPLATLREDMVVIAASRDREVAVEAGGHGLFTAAVLDALNGGAADHMGTVTAPAIYSYVERRFGARSQRPVYKSSQTYVPVVRQCEPLIDRLKLHRLVELFPKEDTLVWLDPEYEPEDEHGIKKEPVNELKVATSQLFKEYRDAGLLKPSTPGEQLYWTARKSHSVELTPRGREYWWLVRHKKV